jgi:YfiH family protein
MHRENHNNLVYYQFEALAGAPDLVHGIFTRLGGTSSGPFNSLNVGSTVGDDLVNVQQNRQLMAQAMGYQDADTRTTWQVHSADVLVLQDRSPQPWPPIQSDAVITAQTALPLVMRFADCVPLFFYDPVKRVIGMAHAGWRGTVAGVGPATIQTMQDAFGCQPEDIIAGIGPSIGPDRYEVGPEVTAQVQEAFEDSAGLVLPPPGDGRNPRLDLWEANRRALAGAGVGQVEVAGICTASNTREFYSHRAEHGNTGRFGALIALMGENGT